MLRLWGRKRATRVMGHALYFRMSFEVPLVNKTSRSPGTLRSTIYSDVKLHSKDF